MPLVESLGLVRVKIPDVVLLVIGPHSHSPKEKEFFEKLSVYVSEHNLKDNVIFTGPTPYDILLKSYAVCDMMVVPSIWEEPSGIVPIEAMATGKPVLASRVGGLKHRIVDGKTGYLVEKNNPKDLAEKILRLLKSKKLLKKMEKGARKHVEDNYTLGIMMRKHKELYGTILN
jgi:glycosyltransferase involved in cell wall biosynthesis